ncbi:MAG: MFS transporter [Bacteroidales bacterium]|nr:MFS transporter [Bacteroidales bacterium]
MKKPDTYNPFKRTAEGKFPSLSQNAPLRYVTFSFLYFAQGLPEGLLRFGIPAWLAMNGKNTIEIGSFVAIGILPWSFKILAAPLMDRFTFLAMGRRRPWILFGQVGLAFSFLSMAFIADPLNNMFMLKVLSFFIGLFAVFQDIAVDGLAIDILPEDQQARANGLMWGSKTIGISASVAIGISIINAYSFFHAIVFFSLFVFLILLIPLFFRERAGEKRLPWTNGKASEVAAGIQVQSWKELFFSLVKVFILPVSLIMGVAAFSFSIGRGLIDAMLPVFTVQELGWTDGKYSQTFAVIKLVSGILGMFVAGAFIDFFGKVRMMSIYLILLISLVVSAFFLRDYWDNPVVFIGFIGLFYTLIVFTTIAVFASAMQLCWKRISATQFTLYMAISNLGMASGAALLGPIKSFLAWEYVVLAFAVFAGFMLIAIQFLHFDKHTKRVAVLELYQTRLDETAGKLKPVELVAPLEKKQTHK